MNSLEKERQQDGCTHGIWDNLTVCRLKTAYHRVNIRKRIEECFCKKSALRMIEFGPGLGCLINLVHTDWPQTEYHAVDIDPGVLKSLCVRFPFLQTHCAAGISDLESIDGCFDVIAAVDVWEHLPLPVALAYTKWCWQRLNPGGMLILQTPNWGCPATPSAFYSDLTHCTPFNEESIRHLFKSADIPDESFSVFPRKTPGFLGVIRDGLLGLFGVFYRLVFVFFGAVRLKVFSADLVAVVRKPGQ
jgi:hypothetical protein